MRSIDEIVRDTIGNQCMQIIALTAQLEAAQARIKELEAKCQSQS